MYDGEHRALGLAKQGLSVPRSDQPLALTFEVDGRVLASERVVPSEDRELVVKVTGRPPRTPSHSSGRRGRPAANDGGQDPIGQGPNNVNPDSTERPPGL